MKKLCIVGAATSAKYAPINEDVEIWTLNHHVLSFDWVKSFRDASGGGEEQEGDCLKSASVLKAEKRMSFSSSCWRGTSLTREGPFREKCPWHSTDDVVPKAKGRMSSGCLWHSTDDVVPKAEKRMSSGCLWHSTDDVVPKAEKRMSSKCLWHHFDLHIPYKNYYKNYKAYAKWLKENQERLWIMDKSEDFPRANVIGYKQLIKTYGNYFTSSIAWMLAFAIEKGFTNISLYGVEMATKHEYEQQRACVEYFLGIARGKEIKIYIHPASKLLKNSVLYGL